MAANQSQSESRRFFKLIAKAEKTNGKQAIVEVVKNGEDYVQDQWFSSISGFAKHSEVKSFEFEGATKKKCVLTLEDEDGVYQLEFTFNFATYGLINSMLAADFTQRVDIGAWIKTDKATKKSNVGASIRYEGEKENIKWSLEPKDCPKGVEYFTPAKEKKVDYTNVSDFWEAKFLEVCASINSKKHTIAKNEPKQPVVPVAATDADLVGDLDSDLPF